MTNPFIEMAKHCIVKARSKLKAKGKKLTVSDSLPAEGDLIAYRRHSMSEKRTHYGEIRKLFHADEPKTKRRKATLNQHLQKL